MNSEARPPKGEEMEFRTKLKGMEVDGRKHTSSVTREQKEGVNHEEPLFR